MNATYSPDDNKLRLYSESRLDKETYARVKAAGFKYAPKQELFVAPMWTPDREDLLLELCGEIGDEDTSLVERAEQRAERFEAYSEHRTEDAEQARATVHRICDGIPFGQPILVGHHSERHARKDQERIDNGMHKAVTMWKRADYWANRAKGALAAARYKEQPDVRERRIKKLEAEQRSRERTKAQAEHSLSVWSREGLTHEEALKFAGTSDSGWLQLPRKDGDRPDFNGNPTAYDALANSHPTLFGPRTLEEVVQVAKDTYPKTIARCERWIAHYQRRIEYERAMLAAS